MIFIPLVGESKERFLSTQWAASFLFMAFPGIAKLIIPKSLPAVLTWLLCIIIALEIADLLPYTFPAASQTSPLQTNWLCPLHSSSVFPHSFVS